MGVAGQIVENMFRAAKRRLGVDHPVLPEELAQEAGKAAGRGQIDERAVKLQLAVLEELLQSGGELAAEDAAKCVDRQEESARGIDPFGTIESQAAGGNDVVDVGMMLKVLPPGMKYAETADVGSEVLRIASQFEHRRGACAKEQIVEQPLVLQCKSGEFMRQREDDVEIRNGQQVSRARRQPFCARVPLALWAVS